jgi:hypothetical protein
MSSSLRELSTVVSNRLAVAAERASTFVRESGLACRVGCAECCLGAHVECTPLELLPVAFDLIDEGQGEEMLASLARLQREPQSVGCVFLERQGHAPDGRLLGRCGRYARRPAVCIHFGASVRLAGGGERTVVACRVMKDDDPVRVAAANAWVSARAHDALNVPSISDDAVSLMALSPALGTQRLPFNEALKAALEKALNAVAYEADVEE